MIVFSSACAGLAGSNFILVYYLDISLLVILLKNMMFTHFNPS